MTQYSGMWTSRQQMQARGANNWPSPISGTTPNVQYLVVAGGGAGGTDAGGGGGAGGYLSGTQAVSAGVAYTVTIGSGGAGGSSPAGKGTNSSFISITADGGGCGNYNGGSTTNPNINGGSGGGARDSTDPYGTGVSGQGNRGGDGSGNTAGGSGGGTGGGGAGGIGLLWVGPSAATDGGPGLQWFDGNWYAGGGGGGIDSVGTTRGAGGIGGGGTGGGAAGAPVATAGTVNTGGGGGGGCGSGGTSNAGANGGSGVVILRYLDSYSAAASTTGSPTVTVSGGYRYYKWTGSGSITF